MLFKSLFSLVVAFLFSTSAFGQNACSVLTQAEASKAAGVEVSEGNLTEYQEAFMKGTTLCLFESLDAKKYKSNVIIELNIMNSPEEAAEKFRDRLALVEKHSVVQNLGDEAAWGHGDHKPAGGLTVRQGNHVVLIKANRGDDAENLEASKTLATTILSRLGSEPAQATPAMHTPAVGARERKAILDALRSEMKKYHGMEMVFVVVTMNVADNWAWLHTRPQSKDGTSSYEDVTALMRKKAGSWEVVEMPCGEITEADACSDVPPFFDQLRNVNPQISPAPLLMD